MSFVDNSDHARKTDTTSDSLLTDREVAKITRMSLAWLCHRRRMNDGPPYRRLGGCIRYDPVELRAWLASRPTGGEGTQEVKGA